MGEGIWGRSISEVYLLVWMRSCWSFSGCGGGGVESFSMGGGVEGCGAWGAWGTWGAWAAGIAGGVESPDGLGIWGARAKDYQRGWETAGGDEDDCCGYLRRNWIQHLVSSFIWSPGPYSLVQCAQPSEQFSWITVARVSLNNELKVLPIQRKLFREGDSLRLSKNTHQLPAIT